VSHDDDPVKAFERVQKLLLIAVQSSAVEEQRTAAHECCRLIHKHKFKIVQDGAAAAEAPPDPRVGYKIPLCPRCGLPMLGGTCGFCSMYGYAQSSAAPSRCTTCGEPTPLPGVCLNCVFKRGVAKARAQRADRPPQKRGTSRRICRGCEAVIEWDNPTGLCANCSRKKVVVNCVGCGALAPAGWTDEEARVNAYAAGFRPVGGKAYCGPCAVEAEKRCR
jgi:hypothetical protein